MVHLDKRTIMVIIIAVVSITAVLLYVNSMNKDEELQTANETPIEVENIGGEFNTTVITWDDHVALEYEDEGGEHTEAYFNVEMRSGLDWIKANTPENATFLCWWDYGHMIAGYTERDVVVRNPSEELLDSIMNPSETQELESHEKIVDVATAFSASNVPEMQNILDKYGVTHILVCSDDIMKAGWIFKSAGLEPTDYVVSEGSNFEFTDAGMQTMIAKLLENRDTGFPLIYEDEEIKVYHVERESVADIDLSG